MASFSSSAQQPRRNDRLLDRLTGTWILQGTIAGRDTTHDVKSEWVLNHEYLRFHETLRRRTSKASPRMRRWSLLNGTNHRTNTGACGSIRPGAVVSRPIAEGKRGNDEIAFIFRDKDKDSGIHTTFVYSKGSDTWNWLIDNEHGGKLTSFARVKLTRK